MNRALHHYLKQTTDAATLAFFRLAFGLLMFFSTLRFVSKGWVASFYIEPNFHFKYYGFEWVRPFGIYTYLLFAVCAVAALMLAIGYRYKWAAITFFLSFTYIELLDKTTYLNHYYFVSVVALLLVFVPANASFSVDAARHPKGAFDRIPRWSTDVFKLLLCIVYFYAGLAKLNSDWLLEAMPLKIWLPNNAHLPVLGPMIAQEWVIYAFSWIGALYDLSIPFLLLYQPTRRFAFLLVVVFHILTKILFPIGVFPYVMIVAALIFFDADWHRKVLYWLTSKWGWGQKHPDETTPKVQRLDWKSRVQLGFIALLLLFQLVFPWRYLCYPDELFWTEEGYRFSWRVMLMEKAGYTQLKVVDAKTGKTALVNNEDYLTAFQEKQMAFQPDFILQYAHYLAQVYARKGWNEPMVFADSYVALNGRLSERYIDPKINLAKEQESFAHKTWLLPFHDEIKGF